MSDGYKVYVSRDELEALKLEIMGDLDEIGDLVGGEESETEEVIWSDTISGFTYNEEMGGYSAPYTKGFPDAEAGLYKISINGEVSDGSVVVDVDEGIFVIMSQDTPKIYIMFDPSMETVLSMTELEGDVEIKLIKSDDMVDWAIYIEPKPDKDRGWVEALFTEDYFVNDETSSFVYTVKDNNGSLIFEYTTAALAIYLDESFGYSRWRMYTKDADIEIYNAIRSSIDTNTPLFFTVTQTLESGEVITKTVSGVPVVRGDLINYEGEPYYCWGNSDAFIMGE